MSIKSTILNNIGLKILALITAVVLWFYVSVEQDHLKAKKMVDDRAQKESSKQK